MTHTPEHQGIEDKFNCLSDLADYVEKTPRTTAYANSSAGDPSAWAGETLEDAINHARHGQPELYERIVKNVSLLIPAAKEIDWNFSHAGDEIDVAAYCQGQPDCFLEEEEEEGKSYLSLLINIGVSAKISAELMENFGVMICSLIDALEKNGTRTQLRVFCGSQNRKNKQMTCTTTIKTYSQMLDIGAVAFSLCNPAYLRRLMFKLWETKPEPIINAWDIGQGYGRPIQSITSETPEEVVIENRGDMFDLLAIKQEIERLKNKLSKR
jgi:hypothetical protein